MCRTRRRCTMPCWNGWSTMRTLDIPRWSTFWARSDVSSSRRNSWMTKWRTARFWRRRRRVKSTWLGFLRYCYKTHSLCKCGKNNDFWQDLTLHKRTAVKERTPNTPRVIYIAGGYYRQSLDVLEGYNVDDKTWHKLDSLTVPRSGLGGAFLRVSITTCHWTTSNTP